MAPSQNPEISATELELKRRGRRRLVGAITIGLLAIVFLPMIFDSEPKRAGQAMKSQDISVQVPSKEGQPALPPPAAAPVVVPPAPVAAAPTVAATPVAEAPKVAGVAPETSKAAVAPAASPPAAKEPPKAAAKIEKVAKAEAGAPADKTGFVVQLGVFGDADNAKLAVTKMKEAKLVVYTESIPIKTGNATRVRVGPFATREKADAALAQVKLAGADGKIVPLK